MFVGILELLSSIFFFTGHLGNKSAYPKPLDKVAEAECVQKMLNGNQQAFETLVKHNMRLVAHIAKKYSNSGELDDLISIGSIGLIKGVRCYKPGKSTTLATFLARCIENEILMTLRSNKRYKNTLYLNEPLGVDSDGNEFSLMDLLYVKEESVFGQVDKNVLAEKINNILLDTLNEREYTIIKYRFGLGGVPVLTQLQTAEKLKISRSYISRIETKALSKLRSKLNKDEFE